MKTTREEAKENIHENLNNNLQALLEKNYDAEEGYKKAMTNAKNEQLKNFLKHQSAQRQKFATELDQEIRNINETPKESGSATGKLHRTWMDVKSALSFNNDEALLEECIRGEKASVEEYEEVLTKNRFEPGLEQVLQAQKSTIQNTLNTVKSLEDLADNWNE
ncbi:ferritin-like domain-containing protein [Altibacter sp. HG106]|uniref:ferritin-like domain-containing protein n=1 Tax=Altibacter sp. HG106 TaxID=3023937 RepID=UPI002350AD6B|nr:PA2169 family four-helix-bundle protein [Altibacter sp. HG106]MDC7995520.1 PA2169 family four-helix-bundle protein [Altibacter sp. HG106]